MNRSSNAYEDAKAVYNAFTKNAMCAIVLVLLSVLFLIKGPTFLPKWPSDAWGTLSAIIAIFVGLLALPVATIGPQIALLQMQQVEEQRASDAALAEAIRDLAKELRGRPEVSSLVTFALFASEIEKRDQNATHNSQHRDNAAGQKHNTPSPRERGASPNE